MNKEFFILIIILYLYLLIYLNKKIKEADNIVNIYFEKLDTYSIKDVHISITATFGDVKIFVPKEWSVENRISSILGEVNTPFATPNTNDVKIILTGNATFAEVSIIYI